MLESSWKHSIPRSSGVILKIAFFMMALVLVAFFAPGHCEAQDRPPKDWVWLGNRALKVGLVRSSGGAIGWISEAGSDSNLVNHFDRGRLVQQSWYGSVDGSDWNGKPWRWNPVQGGDWKGKSATILEQKVTEDSAFIRTRPVHWASGADIEDAIMEQTISLEDDLLHLKCRFVYSGKIDHPAHHQEMPALFVTPELSTLVTYTGTEPWQQKSVQRSSPGWPNEYRRMTEHWAAWVDDKGHGLGICVPSADELTCYRFGDGNAKRGACSYLAPIRTLAVTKDFDHTWDIWLTIGTTEQIRSRFQKVMGAADKK